MSSYGSYSFPRHKFHSTPTAFEVIIAAGSAFHASVATRIASLGDGDFKAAIIAAQNISSFQFVTHYHFYHFSVNVYEN